MLCYFYIAGISGDVGVVYLVEDVDSLDWVTKNGPHSPYVALIYPNFMTNNVMKQFKSSNRISGVLLLNDTAIIKNLTKFSPEMTCPNEGLGK